MERQVLLKKLIEKSKARDELDPFHISLFTTLSIYWLLNGRHNPFNIRRRYVMRDARIRSQATYHSKMSELVDWGFIEYIPSHHPERGTTIYLLF